MRMDWNKILLRVFTACVVGFSPMQKQVNAHRRSSSCLAQYCNINRCGSFQKVGIIAFMEASMEVCTSANIL